MNQTLINAIANRQVLRLEYDGFYREVEPHTYGINHAGHPVLSCWQTMGGSASGESQGWKLLLVADIHATTKTGAVFHGARPNYRRDTKSMRHIYAQL